MESQEEKAPTRETASSWTEEKHVQFLNSMEASFVSEMMQNNDRSSFRPLCLRRHVPPSSDSTSDLKPHTASANHTLSGDMTDLTAARGRSRRRIRRTIGTSSQPHNELQDQVVPQMGKEREVIGGDEEQRSSV